jgi:hypothetical protein
MRIKVNEFMNYIKAEIRFFKFKNFIGNYQQEIGHYSSDNIKSKTFIAFFELINKIKSNQINIFCDIFYCINYLKNN